MVNCVDSYLAIASYRRTVYNRSHLRPARLGFCSFMYRSSAHIIHISYRRNRCPDPNNGKTLIIKVRNRPQKGKIPFCTYCRIHLANIHIYGRQYLPWKNHLQEIVFIHLNLAARNTMNARNTRHLADNPYN